MKYERASVLIGGLLALLLAPVADAAPVSMTSVKLERATIELYERCELTVQLQGAIANPYDPAEVSLEATFQAPTGDPVTVYGFYYEPFERLRDAGRDTLKAAGPPVWKGRFTPRQTGRWSYRVKLVTPGGSETSAADALLVTQSQRRGFVHLDKRRGNYWFDTGAPFIPIGENLCWGPSFQPLKAYDRWFSDLSSQHANYIRMWLAPWALRLETKDTGVGRYDQARAWQLDYLLERSEEAGLFWQLCLLNHGSFSRSQDPDWQNNPYNTQLGGMCRLPNDFVTDPRAKLKFEHLLRYLVSRFGYSPALVYWELFNEPDLSELRLEDFSSWAAQMSQRLTEQDPNHRPITTSFHHEVPPAVWNLPTMDAIQIHAYDQRDFPALFTGPHISELQERFHKPVFVGEFGWISDTMRQFDDIGIHLHDGLWSSIIGGSAGGALVWYWDTYVHPNRLYRHLRPLEAFWRGEQLGKDLGRMNMALSTPHLAGWGLGNSEHAYLWIKNRQHSLDSYIAYRCEVAKRRVRLARGQKTDAIIVYAPAVVETAHATIQGLKWTGRYRIEWWDPYRGRIVSRAVGRATLGKMSVDVPSVQFDLAAKLVRLEWWERGAS